MTSLSIATASDPAAPAVPDGRAALEAFIVRHAGFVPALARRVLGNAADADDVAQAVFLACWRASRKLDAERDPRGWLAAVTLNACRDRLKAERRRRDAHARLPLPQPEPARDWTELRDALLALPERDRTALGLRFLQGLRLREVAEALRLPQKTVETRLRRALAKLRRRLAPAALALLAGWKAEAGEEEAVSDARRICDPEDEARLARTVLRRAVRERRSANPAWKPILAASALVVAASLLIGAAAQWVERGRPGTAFDPRHDPIADGPETGDTLVSTTYAARVAVGELAALGLDPAALRQVVDDPIGRELLIRAAASSLMQEFSDRVPPMTDPARILAKARSGLRSLSLVSSPILLLGATGAPLARNWAVSESATVYSRSRREGPLPGGPSLAVCLPPGAEGAAGDLARLDPAISPIPSGKALVLRDQAVTGDGPGTVRLIVVRQRFADEARNIPSNPAPARETAPEEIPGEAEPTPPRGTT